MFEITDVQIHRVPQLNGTSRLLAFVSIEIDRVFVIRELKIVNGKSGLFVCMPNRKVTDKCYKCAKRVPLDASYCGWCGDLQEKGRNLCEFCDGRGYHKVSHPSGKLSYIHCADCGGRGTTPIFVDVAHPITAECREYITKVVLDAYRKDVSDDDHLSRVEALEQWEGVAYE